MILTFDYLVRGSTIDLYFFAFGVSYSILWRQWWRRWKADPRKGKARGWLPIVLESKQNLRLKNINNMGPIIGRVLALNFNLKISVFFMLRQKSNVVVVNKINLLVILKSSK